MIESKLNVNIKRPLIMPQNLSPWTDDEFDAVAAEVWPEAWSHCQIVDECWDRVWQKYLDHKFICSIDGKLAATFLVAPVPWTGSDFSALPDHGLEWVFRSNLNKTKQTRVVSAVTMNIRHNYRGQKLSAEILSVAKNLLRERGIQYLIAPVRPSFKYKFPLIPMKEYVTWRTEDGKVFDPWLRVHVNLGAHIVKICHQSITIRGTIKEWHQWAGIDVIGPGDYIVPFALNAVRFTYDSVGTLQGTYVEPNVWVVHEIGL